MSTSAQNQAPRPTVPEPTLYGRLESVPGKSWRSKQAYHVIQQPVSVVSHCDAECLAEGAG